MALKYPERHKCQRCGSSDYWVWDDADWFWTCDQDGNELYPPRITRDLWGGRYVFSQAGKVEE